MAKPTANQITMADLLQHFEVTLEQIVDDNCMEPIVAPIPPRYDEDGDVMIENGPPPDWLYENDWEKYLILDSDKPDFYTRQYYHYYQMRTTHLTPRIIENAKVILGSSIEALPLGDVKRGEKAFVIGCFIKRMKNRMAVLKDLEDEDNDEVEITHVIEDELDNLALDTDYLDFEDAHKQVVTLKGNVDPSRFVTGAVVGIYGTQVSDNQFEVEQVILPSLAPYIPRPLLEEDVYVAFTSGFNITEPCDHKLNEIAFLASVLNTKKYYNKIARMVLAGNHSTTFCQCDSCKGTSINNVMPIGLSLDAEKEDNALRIADSFKNNLCHIDIDIMPGEGDPCPIFLPQQPLCKALVEDYYISSEEEEENEEIDLEVDTKIDVVKIESIKPSQESADVKLNVKNEPDRIKPLKQTRKEKFFEEYPDRHLAHEEYSEAADYFLLDLLGLEPGHQRVFQAVTNPYAFKVMGFSFHGTSGQNVNDYRRLTKKGKTTAEIMKEIIELGSVVPTAPDFTDCFPYDRNDGKDPLVLDQMPHVFFAGNQDTFSYETVDFDNDRKVLLLGIPRYDQTRTIVLLNLRTMKPTRVVVPHYLEMDKKKKNLRLISLSENQKHKY